MHARIHIKYKPCMYNLLFCMSSTAMYVVQHQQKLLQNPATVQFHHAVKIKQFFVCKNQHIN